MRNIRVWFEKHEQAKFISHLDLNRYMPRAIRRAKIPAWYTEGFNKHLYINFALPLSLGFESRNDCFEIRIIDDSFTDEQVLSNLNDAMPLGIDIIKITEPKDLFKNICFAEYDITLDLSSDNLKRVSDIFLRETISVDKKSKRGIKTVNLKEYISDISLKDENGNLLINILLPAGCGENINPSLVLQALSNEFLREIDYIKIVRKGFKTADLKGFK